MFDLFGYWVAVSAPIFGLVVVLCLILSSLMIPIIQYITGKGWYDSHDLKEKLFSCHLDYGLFLKGKKRLHEGVLWLFLIYSGIYFLGHLAYVSQNVAVGFLTSLSLYAEWSAPFFGSLGLLLLVVYTVLRISRTIYQVTTKIDELTKNKKARDE